MAVGTHTGSVFYTVTMPFFRVSTKWTSIMLGPWSAPSGLAVREEPLDRCVRPEATWRLGGTELCCLCSLCTWTCCCFTHGLQHPRPPTCRAQRVPKVTPSASSPGAGLFRPGVLHPQVFGRLVSWSSKAAQHSAHSPPLVPCSLLQAPGPKDWHLWSDPRPPLMPWSHSSAGVFPGRVGRPLWCCRGRVGSPSAPGGPGSWGNFSHHKGV